ncbi:MAG: hypothetical protein IPO09_11295 [Anaeromyxobacter sp.]|nr:hypothetical protein [Anaeromyxobacter sp.]MBL0276840.1 hypothetical protein [Anaeromyxobacter sp.]
MTTPRRTTARWLAGLAPLFLLGLALPLLAPSCGDFQPGVKSFAKGSLIIPMDVCYQCTRQSADGFDAATGNCARTGWVSAPSGNACPQALAQGDVMRAYGLVYQLIRNDVAVYWVIDPAKTAIDGYDLAIQYQGGFPVAELDWATGLPGASPVASATIRYMGGPFVVDGSDAAKAIAVMKAYQSTFGAVNVHVASVAFQGNVAKTMAGGWGAGGAVPPKLALLDIGSGNITATSPVTMNSAKNSEPVIQEYLARAGIGSGAAGGTATGVHGEIYDKLGIDDFQPAAGSTDPRTSRLFQNGYQILWVPHWVAPGSCSNYSSNATCAASLYSAARVDQVLKTIGLFVAGGGDLFAECAGLGSFEGVRRSDGSWSLDYEDGASDHSSQLQTPVDASPPDTLSGMRINQRNPGAPLYAGSFSSPLLQLGDFPFKPYDGAIKIYRPYSAYVTASPPLVRLTQDTTDQTLDYFTLLPRAASGGRGSVVYLAGHSYSGVQGSFQAGGSRLVVNTLFNLGATCTASGVSCATGLLGACGQGVLGCSASGQPVCSPTTTGDDEACNGVDDDCDGLVDEDLEQGCYGGPTGTQGVGLCRAGVRTCQVNPDGGYGFSACQGEVLPTPEGCNGLDDDCDGEVDELAPSVRLSEACYSGSPGTQGVGACRGGTRTCTAGTWGGCAGEVTPVGDPCNSPEGGTTALDRDCNGAIDACGSCPPGQVRDCYDGPAGTDGVGPCRRGSQTCSSFGEWSTCAGAVKPGEEVCRNDVDENCNGPTDDDPPFCNACKPTDPVVTCWTGPADAVFQSPTRPDAVCVRGTVLCLPSGELGGCVQQTLPGPELCNGKDDDCDDQVDDGVACGAGFACENGVCVFSSCGPEVPCREGYDCIAGACKLTACGAGGACDAGTVCDFGSCSDPCAGITCGVGSTCAGGYCTGGACYAEGCPAGSVCQAGTCVADTCQGIICPGGTFCRQGDCVQACAFVTCGPAERCDGDGFCAADPCAGKTCAPSLSCRDGVCVADACVGVACGQGQQCRAGVCEDDPCAGVTCPAGQCRDGQCFAVRRPAEGTGAGGEGSSGCGCGGGAGSPLALLGLLLALPLARRRRPGRASPRGGLLLLVVLAGLPAAGCQKAAAPFDPLACAALAVPLGTCETESRCIDHFNDPSHCGACGQACGAGNWCVDGVCGPASTVAPRLTGVSPSLAPTGGLAPVAVTLTGERLADGASLRASSDFGTVTVPTTRQANGSLLASLDLSGAAAGTWVLRVVNPDLVISNGRAFGVVIPTPVITAVVPVPDLSPGASPPQVVAGGLRTLRLVGTGLMVGSACRLGGSTLSEREVPAELTAAGLECQADLSSVQPGRYDVWVVNDADHVSARAPFQVVSAAPVLTTLAPSSARFNTTTGVQLFGSGFDVTSKVWFTGPGFPAGLAQNTTFVDPTRLIVDLLDLQRCPAAPCPVTDPTHRYTLEVRNGPQVSEQKELFVEAATRTVSAMAPVTAYQGDLQPVTISGSGLSGSLLQVRPPGGAFATAPLDPLRPNTDGAISGVVDLVGTPPGAAPAGSWDVRLLYPTGATSASFSLRVDSNRAIIVATPQPAGGEAGLTVAVTLTVANLRPPLSAVRVRLSDPTPGATFTLEPTPLSFPAADKVVVSLPLAGLQTKVYALAVVNPSGAAPSNPYNFTVLPGQPTVTSVACTSLPPAAGALCPSASSARQQATPVPVRIDGTNFARPDAAGNNGSQVRVSSAALGVVDQLLPAAAVTVTSATRIDVALDTTLAVPGTYALSIWNQGGAQRSTPLAGAFTILP